MIPQGALDRAARIGLLAWLPLRVWLDLAHGVVGGAAFARILTGLFSLGVIALAGLALVRGPHRLRPALALFSFALLVGFVRSSLGFGEALGLALLYLGPPAYGVAVSTWLRRPEEIRWLLGGALIFAVLPVGWAAFAWGTGDLGPTLHGYRRLIEPYTSHHNLAVAMLTFATLGIWFAARREPWFVRIYSALLAGISLALMAATYVRTTALWGLIAGGVALVAWRRWGWLAAFALLGGLLVWQSPALQERASDALRVLTLAAPEEGWGAIGSWRVYIWTDAWGAFVAQGPAALLLGLGLGAHQTLHKALDPHHEYLTLWFQLGLTGLIAYLWMLGIALRDALRGLQGPRREVATLALAMLTAVLWTNALSNDFLSRPLLAYVVWGVAGLVWAGASDQRESSVR